MENYNLVDLAQLEALQNKIKELEEANQIANLRAYKAEQQLQLLENIINHSAAGIFAFDSQGKFVYASPINAAAVGLTASEIVGRTWYELNLPPDGIQFWENLQKKNPNRRNLFRVFYSAHF